MWQGAKLEWLDNPPRERGRQCLLSLLDPIQNDWSEWEYSNPCRRSPLTGGFRRGRRGSRGRLLCDGLLDGGLLRRGLLRLRSLGPLQRPTLLRGGDDRLPASLRQPPFWLGRYLWGGGLRRRLGLRPSLSLGLGNPSTASRTHLPPFVFCRFRLDCGFSGVTGQYRPELGNVGVDVAFLFLETENSGANDFGSEFCRHVFAFSDLRFPFHNTPSCCRSASLLIIMGGWGQCRLLVRLRAVPSALAKSDQVCSGKVTHQNRQNRAPRVTDMTPGAIRDQNVFAL